MPRGNGTGSDGQGPGTGSGRGRMDGTRPGSGPIGNCLCPNCGKKVPHQAGTPCYAEKCPACGTKMIRE